VPLRLSSSARYVPDRLERLRRGEMSLPIRISHRLAISGLGCPGAFWGRSYGCRVLLRLPSSVRYVPDRFERLRRGEMSLPRESAFNCQYRLKIPHYSGRKFPSPREVVVYSFGW